MKTMLGQRFDSLAPLSCAKQADPMMKRPIKMCFMINHFRNGMDGLMMSFGELSLFSTISIICRFTHGIWNVQQDVVYRKRRARTVGFEW
jgi:hypothetical protein